MQHGHTTAGTRLLMVGALVGMQGHDRVEARRLVPAEPTVDVARTTTRAFPPLVVRRDVGIAQLPQLGLEPTLATGHVGDPGGGRYVRGDPLREEPEAT
jgi:hypothetical protein